MAMIKVLCGLLSLFAPLAWSASMYLPSFPLAVKTPYLSVWMPGHLSHDFPTATPQFWQGQELTWIILARIEDTSYCLLGCTGGRLGTVPAVQKSLNFTSTHTYVTLDAGSTEITMDFFSPVDPIDHVRQSLPYSYVTISATGVKGSKPKIGYLTAIDASWLSNRGTPNATFESIDGAKILRLNGNQGAEYSEWNQMARWGDVILAAHDDSTGSAASCQVGSADAVFGSFVDRRDLTGSIGPMAAGSIAACSRSVAPDSSTGVTFAIGLDQEREMQYFDGINTTAQAGYYRSKVSNVSEAVSYFFNDFEKASAQSREFDRQIRAIGGVTSANYSDLLEFAVRQSFAGMQVTIPADTLNTSLPYAFIKEISTDGNVNTLADLIPKALPIFHVLNPEYTRMFLEPVLRFSINAWPLNHAVHDIGKSYPNATGETPCIEEFLPLDSTSVLLWMIYLHQKTTGNAEMTNDYAPILRRYADYCYRYGLYPVLQRSSVDALGSATNQSALSVSAAIALNAYGKMTGQSNYSEAGLAFAEKILDIGRDSNRTHFLTHYTDEDDSWVLMYPLAFDAWLELDTFPSSVHQAQSDWYSKNKYLYGVQYRNSLRYTLMEWQMWVAAVSSNDLRDHLVNAVHRFLSRATGPRESVPGPTQWRILPGPDEGVWTYFSKAKSVIGSIFMIAAVQHGYNDSSVAAQRPAIPSIPTWTPDDQTFKVQDKDYDALQRLDDGHAPIPWKESGIPFDVPLGASKPVDSSFLGLSFDTASFPAYSGNVSAPNSLTIDLIRNLIRASGATLTIRIGSPEGDYSIYDPIQSTPLKRLDISGTSTLSLGPSYFDSIRALDTLQRTNWIYQVPFAPFDVVNAVQGAQGAMAAVPAKRLFALEIGHKPNLYAGTIRPDSYGCQTYAAELFQYKAALRNKIDRIGTQFQALGLSHDSIDENWDMEHCFTVGIKAQEDLKSVAVHFSQVGSHSELDTSNLPRHSAVRRELRNISPHADYVREIFPCHPFVISEASLVSTAAEDHDTGIKEFDHQSSLEVALWNLDFLLYSMSQNVSKVLMHQSCNSTSSAWIPGSCSPSDSKDKSSNEVKSSYYALTFVASFVRDAGDFRVVPLQESEDEVVYAGYEAGKLSKIAVVNFPSREGSGSLSNTGQKTLNIRVPAEVRHLDQVARISAESLIMAPTTFDKSSWGVRMSDQTPLVQEPTPAFTLNEGLLSITMDQAEALLLVPRY